MISLLVITVYVTKIFFVMTNKTDPYVACSSLEWKLGIHLGEWRASRNLAKRMGKEPSTDVAYLQGVKDLLNDYLSSF